MARRKKRAAKPGFSQSVLLLAAGAVLMLCFISITYGVLIRNSMARNEVRGFQIEVLNGTGQAGLASRARSKLLALGVDVLSTGNADRFDYGESVLIARSGKKDVRALGQLIGCDNVIEQLQKDPFVDATLILGADNGSLKLGLADESRLNR
jgi:hypothetical protein